MRKYNYLLKRGAGILLILSFLFQATPLMAVTQLAPKILKKPADKVPPVPTSDAAIREKEAGITAFGITIPGITLDGLMIILVREAIEELSDATVEWINDRENTDEGGPAFAVDLEGVFKTTMDRIAGNVIEGTGLGALCSPFQSQVREALRLSYSTSKRNADDIEASCTLSQVTNNIEGFLAGDFARGGGWDSWFLVSQDPNGNPFSATLTTKGTVSRKVAEAVGIEKENLNWSGGFLNTRECLNPGPGTRPEDCKEWGPTKTPGVLIEGQLQKVLGSEIDQLNLADEFDEVLAAIAGMLLDSVFNKDGIIDNNGIANRAKNGSSQRSIFGGCTADEFSVILADGKTVTWSYVGGQNVSLRWGGDEIPAGSTGDSVSVVYTSPNLKSAWVEVTRLDANGVAIGSPQRVDCTGQVNVQRFGPLAMTCVGPTPSTVRYGERATWTINITGGSGQLSSIILDQDESLGPEMNNGSGPFWPGYGSAEDVRPAKIVGITPSSLSSWIAGSGFNFRPMGSPIPLTLVNGAFTLTFEIEYRYKVTTGTSATTEDLTLAFKVISDMDNSVFPLVNVGCANSVYIVP